ncbi:MAG: condensation domain-containing protein [bacterium]
MNNKLYELTEPQKSVLMMGKNHQETNITYLSGKLSLDGLIYKYDLLNEAINYVIRNSDGMRIKLLEKDNTTYQYVSDYKNKNIEEYDFTELSEEEKEEMFELWTVEKLTDDLVTFKLIKHSDNKFDVYIKTSHIIYDAFSLGITGGEIRSAYEKLLLGEELVDSNNSYLKFIEREEKYLSSDKYLEDKEYFGNLFKDEVEVFNFSNKITDSIEADRFTYNYSLEDAAEIKKYCSDNGIYESIFFEALVALYIKRLSNKDDVVFGSPTLNRKGSAERNICGMFVNPQVLKVNISDEDTYLDVVNKLAIQKRNLFKRQTYPLEHLTSELNEKFNFSGDLFDIVVSYQNASVLKKQEDSKFDYEVDTKWYFNKNIVNSLIINIDDRSSTGSFQINIDYKTELFTRSEIENMFNRLLVIAKQVMNDVNMKVDDISVFSKKDYEIMSEFNSSEFNEFDQSTIDVFESNAENYPDNIALVYDGKSYTYSELNSYANSLANYFVEEDLIKSDIVPIVGNRNFYTIVSIIAMLKIGKAYFVIDDEQYPTNRIDFLINEVQSNLMLTYGTNYNNSEVEKIDIIKLLHLDTKNPVRQKYKKDNIFCAIHTSGSSGVPKVTVIPDEGVLNMGINNSYLLNDSDSMLSVICMGFDAFLEDVWVPLLNAKTLILTTNEELVNVNSIIDLIQKNESLAINLTPTRLKQIISNTDVSLNNLNTIIIGGEKLSQDLINEVNILCDNPSVYYLYGPTETTVFNCGKLIENSTHSVGKPIKNFKLFIKDKHGIDLPTNQIGEIVVMGTGVALGYYNKEELTSEKFYNSNGNRFYKTGDYGYVNMESELVFCGRDDNQIKINGLRIEIDEVENVMNNFENIALCSVNVQKNNEESLLVGYFESNTDIDLNILRDHMENILPLYMVPHIFVKLDKIPLTNSGKIDRNSLPVIDYSKHLESIYEAPYTSVQETIISVWEDILNIKPIGISSTFESLGGSSKMKIDMISRLEKELSVKINLMYLPKKVTVASIAELIEIKANREKDINLEEYDLNIFSEEIKEINLQNAILVTGAGGYLGSHILEYLTYRNENVYVIVRNVEKFKNALEFYFDNSEEILSRTNILIGDLSKEKFGLTDDQYNTLISEVGIIYNSAANVSHFASIEDSKKDNVDAVYNLMKISAINGAVLNQVSTITISGIGMSTQNNNNLVFTEDRLDIGQDVSHDAYMLSKFKAEELISKAKEKGLASNVYRLGYIDERSYDNKFQINEDTSIFKMIVDTIKEIKYFPRAAIDAKIQLMSVDETVKNIIKLSNLTGNETYHIYDNSIELLTDYLRYKGVEFEVIDDEKFFEFADAKIEETHNPNYTIVYQYLNSYIENPTSNLISNDYTNLKLKISSNVRIRDKK